MKKALRFFFKIALVIAVSWQASWCLSASAGEPIPPFEIRQVADGIYVAFKPAPHRIIDSNIGIIVNQNEVVIIDANDNLANAKKLTTEIKALTDKPVHYVINTHWHSDHILANSLYAEAFSQIKAFVGHVSLRETIDSKTQPQLTEKIKQWQQAITAAEAKLKAGSAEPGMARKIINAKATLNQLLQARLIKPSMTFTEQMTLPVESRTIKLLHFGRAHTEGDSVVYLPREKILFSGDLFDHLPYAGHGYPREWLNTLRQIARLDIDWVVPGHGAKQKGKGQLNVIIGLLESAIRLASQAVARGQSEADFMASLDISEYRTEFGKLDELGERVFKRFIPEFFQVAYQEAANSAQNPKDH